MASTGSLVFLNKYCSAGKLPFEATQGSNILDIWTL